MKVRYKDYITERELHSFGPEPQPHIPSPDATVVLPGETGWRRVMRIEWRQRRVFVRERKVEEAGPGKNVWEQEVLVLLGAEQGAEANA